MYCRSESQESVGVDVRHGTHMLGRSSDCACDGFTTCLYGVGRILLVKPQSRRYVILSQDFWTNECIVRLVLDHVESSHTFTWSSSWLMC